MALKARCVLLSLFKFKKKAASAPAAPAPERAVENKPVNDKATPDAVFNFVSLALEQERLGNVLLGRRTSSKDGKTEELFFIAFREEQINEFLGEWYETLAAVRKPNSRLNQNGGLYETWIAQKLAQFQTK